MTQRIQLPSTALPTKHLRFKYGNHATIDITLICVD